MLLRWQFSHFAKAEKSFFLFEATLRFGLPLLTSFGNFTHEAALLAHAGRQIIQSVVGVMVENNDSLLASLEFVRRDCDNTSRLVHRKRAQQHHISVWKPQKVFINDDRYLSITTCAYLESLHAGDQLPGMSALQIVQNTVNN